MVKKNEDIFFAWIMTHTGKPYHWGGDDAIEGFDCSGFGIEFGKVTGAIKDRNLDTTAKALYKMWPIVGQAILQFGDYVYFGTPENVTHTAIVLNPYFMFEFGGGGSNTNTLADAVKQNAVGRVRPISARKDLVGFNRPPHDWSF